MQHTRNRIQDVDELVGTIEAKLARLVSSGWRLASGDAGALVADADTVASIGLHDLACRLRDVAAAERPIDGLQAATLAIAACRMLRAQIAPEESITEEWRPLSNFHRRWATEEDAILPLCRFSLGGIEVWSCLRSRGFSVEWTFIRPPDVETGNDPHWLRRPLFGRLHWQERHPLGVNNDVQVHRLDDAAWEAPGPIASDHFSALRKRFRSGGMRESKIPIWGGGSVRLARLERDDIDESYWFDSDVRDRLSNEISENHWALFWEQAETRAVIALLSEDDDRGLRRRVIHLLPTFPTTELP